MKKYKCNIIICGPAIGKTYLAKQDDRFIDIDGMKSDYKYNLHQLTQKEKEYGKLNRGPTINQDSTKYAIELLENTIKENKIALLSYHSKILEYIKKNNYKYCLVYADKNLSKEYATRMKSRGNNQEFINQMTNEKEWLQFYKQNSNDKNATYKIKLTTGQYLSDIKDIFI